MCFYIARMHLIQDILSFTRHRFHSRRWDYFHSPYLFQLFTFCCDDSNHLGGFEKIEGVRAALLASQEMINLHDYGAGHQGKTNRKEISISTIAQQSLSTPFQGRFMARLGRFHKPQKIVEFGTSLGISAAYLATGSPGCEVLTIEGDPMVGAKAISVFKMLEIKNIELINDTFESCIMNRIQSIDRIDLLFLDGNHRKKALVTYYHALKKLCHENTIIIVDDIYWSAEMTSAWQEIIREKEITQSVDCFQFGLLFFSPHFLAKEHHRIRLPLKAFVRN